MKISIDLNKNKWILEDKELSGNQILLENYLNDLLLLGFQVSKSIKIDLNQNQTDNSINLQIKSLLENFENNNNKLNNLQENINTFKNDISSTLISQTNITNNQCETLNNCILKLTGNLSTSSLKGQIGENFIGNILKTQFPDDTVNETAKTKHESDIHLISSSFPTILIESKIYKNAVNTDEINKFLYDLDNTDINFGLFISLTSGIVKHKRLEYCFLNNKHIVFIPNAGFDGNNIFYGIIFLREISKIKNTNYINEDLYEEKCEKINQLLNNFEKAFLHIKKLKSKTIEFKNIIDKQLLNLTTDIFESEFIIKDIIEKNKLEIQKILVCNKFKNQSIQFFDEIISRYSNTQNKFYNNLAIHLQFLKDNNYSIQIDENSKTDLYRLINNINIIELKIFKTKCLFNFENGLKYEVFENSDLVKFNNILNFITS